MSILSSFIYKRLIRLRCRRCIHCSSTSFKLNTHNELTFETVIKATAKFKNANEINEDKPLQQVDKFSPEYKNEMDTLINNPERLEVVDKMEKLKSNKDASESIPPKESKRTARLKKLSKSSKITFDINSAYQTTKDMAKKPLRQCIPPKTKDIPQLAHNLDRVLFSPGIHFLQDPRTRVYNFSPFLKKVISYKDFNFDAIGSYTPVDKHKTLLENAKKFKKQFYSSTSSMTSMLSKFYMVLNNYSPRKIERFGDIPFTGLATKLPSSLFVEPKGVYDIEGKQETVYSIQADKSCDSEIILSAMGLCMECLLTNPEDEFVKYRKDHEDSEPEQPKNSYNYAGFGKFLMRSQLDCFDPRLPNNGTFDLKTRASTNIRYNSHDPNSSETNYQIFKLKGNYESYEKEFKDLIRTGALLKYLFQARIGQMDGIFIAYHNINSIFGFQYLPVEELDKIFYSRVSNDDVLMEDATDEEVERFLQNDNLPSYVGEMQFKFSMEIWEILLTEHILKDLPKDTAFRLVAQTYKPPYGKQNQLKIYVIPVTPKEINTFQSFNEKYPSDFKSNLTPEQRDINLQAHAKELKKFNSETLKDKQLLSYIISMGNGNIDGQLKPYSELPTSINQPWNLQYHIKRQKNPTIEEFEQVFELPIQQLTGISPNESNTYKSKFIKNLQDIHKRYEKLGGARKQNWKELEQIPKVYRPKYQL
ncbi:PET127 [Candida pseudojiufengensis]|uniref:PET127 n=1 Tax=Candida pseudojiufengensis TaxID=497109 RepID=UPI0022249FDF|nr:PET127 [Candida pseudojiufengensis]KAI5964890.1 PET127 [Candida pseudojiufengensis]